MIGWRAFQESLLIGQWAGRDSLVAPVQAHSDVAFDLPQLLLHQVGRQHLSAQVDQLVHHMTQLVEQVHLVLLQGEKQLKYNPYTHLYSHIYILPGQEQLK